MTLRKTHRQLSSVQSTGVEYGCLQKRECKQTTTLSADKWACTRRLNLRYPSLPTSRSVSRAPARSPPLTGAGVSAGAFAQMQPAHGRSCGDLSLHPSRAGRPSTCSPLSSGRTWSLSERSEASRDLGGYRGATSSRIAALVPID